MEQKFCNVAKSPCPLPQIALALVYRKGTIPCPRTSTTFLRTSGQHLDKLAEKFFNFIVNEAIFVLFLAGNYNIE